MAFGSAVFLEFIIATRGMFPRFLLDGSSAVSWIKQRALIEFESNIAPYPAVTEKSDNRVIMFKLSSSSI